MKKYKDALAAEASGPHIGSLDPITFTTAIAALKENEAYLIRWQEITHDDRRIPLRGGAPWALYAIGSCPRNDRWFDMFLHLRRTGRFLSIEHLTYADAMHATHECTLCHKPHVHNL